MAREITIKLYLIVFKIIFNTFKLFPLREKTSFVVSFGDNSLFVYDKMRSSGIDHPVVFLEKGSCNLQLNNPTNSKIIPFESGSLMAMIKSIYHLATSKTIFIDNYFGFLAATNFKEEVEVIQLWHAAGAVKKFGLEDLTIKNRSKSALRRFNKVYDKFDRIVVGSDKMAEIFKKSFNIDDKRILRTGVPRTDLFFDKYYLNKIRNGLYSSNQDFIDKKVILYAPTYREQELNNFKLMLDLDMLRENFADEYIIVLKLHPAVKDNADYYEEEYKGFVYNYSDYDSINELMLVADTLITDYSSIHFEFALLNRPIIFYAYDFDEYARERGITGDYERDLPGPVVKTTGQLIRVISEANFDFEEIGEFAKEWNKYSQGQASLQLINSVYGSRVEVERDVG